MGLNSDVFVPPEPKDGVDFYIDTVERYTVCIEVEVDGLHEDEDGGEDGACWRAVDGFRDRSLDGDATVVYSEKIGEIELDFKTDLPFKRDAWVKATLAEMGLNIKGEPLRPWEKSRPECETTLDDFVVHKIGWLRRCVNYIKWCMTTQTTRRYG